MNFAYPLPAEADCFGKVAGVKVNSRWLQLKSGSKLEAVFLRLGFLQCSIEYKQYH